MTIIPNDDILKMANENCEKQFLIRKGILSDIDSVVDTYNEHFAYEKKYGSVTVFRKGVYPTREDATKAVNAGTLYVSEENNKIVGSIIVDKNQPEEYQKIEWHYSAIDNEVMVIHLLMVCPSRKGHGIATLLVKYAMKLARECSCKEIRLDTGSQNTPAVSLYQKLGFQIVAAAPMKVGGVIGHSDHLFLEKML